VLFFHSMPRSAVRNTHSASRKSLIWSGVAVLAFFNFLCFAGYSLRNAARLSAYATVCLSMARALLSICFSLAQGKSAKGKTGNNEADAGFLHSLLSPFLGWMGRFEDRFQDKLRDVRCSYHVALIRTGDKKSGHAALTAGGFVPWS